MSSAFIKHVSCEECGSSDANALYSDGGMHCFSCGFHARPNGLRRPLFNLAASEADAADDKPIRLPDDVSTEYPPIVVDWIRQYGLSIGDLIINHVVWSPSKQQLIFCFYEMSKQSGEKKLVLYNARCFSPKAKTKYYTQGNKEACSAHYKGISGRVAEKRKQGANQNYETETSNRSVVCCVEDCVSAIKLARHTSLAVPCLGSSLSKGKLTALRALLEPSIRVVVWLDSNMYDKAQQIAQRLQMLGVEASVLWTELDPKCYTDEQIQEFLNDNA